jgi:imidazolonepropionase
MISLGCIVYKLTPEEAVNASTINSAYAMGLSNLVGSISTGKRANLILTKKINSYGFIPYSFANNQIDEVIINGIVFN